MSTHAMVENVRCSGCKRELVRALDGWACTRCRLYWIGPIRDFDDPVAWVRWEDVELANDTNVVS